MERWVRTCRRELLNRTLIWNRAHLLYALRESTSEDGPPRRDSARVRTRSLTSADE